MQELFQKYNNYNIYDREALEHDKLQSEMESAIVAKVKQLTGKKFKFEKACQLLENELLGEIQESFQKIFSDRIAIRKAEKESMELQLKEYAKIYNPVHSDVMHKLSVKSGGDYHTQGYGCNKYAKSALEDDRLLLDLYGYTAEIREVLGGDTDRWGIRHNTYELWADITEFDFWILKHNGKFISVLNWAVLCWRKQTNPKVYFPFLSDDDYEKSLVLYRLSNYQITKENCGMEPSWEEIKKLEENK